MVTHLLFQITIKHNLLFSGEELLDTLETIKSLLLFRMYLLSICTKVQSVKLLLFGLRNVFRCAESIG